MTTALLKEHLGLVVSAFAGLTIVVKLWVVAHGDVTTIAGILASGGTLTSVLGALVVGLPAMGAAPLFLMVAILPDAIREGDGKRGPVVGLIVAIPVALALAPIRIVILCLELFATMMAATLLLVLFRFIWTKWSRRPVPRPLRPSSHPQANGIGLIIATLAVAAWGAGVGNDRPWLPTERIDRVSGEPLIGYVVNDGDDEVTLMQDSDRSILRLAAKDIEMRTLCTSDDPGDRSLISVLFWDVPEYDRCDEP